MRQTEHSRVGRKGFFYRLIWLGCLSACIPIILIGSVYYQMSVNSATREFTKESKSSLTLIQNRMERLLEEMEKLSLQISLDPVVSKSITDPDSLHQHPLNIIHVQNLLQMEKNTSDWIEDILYYNENRDFLISNVYGYSSKADYPDALAIDHALLLNNKAQWTELPLSGDKSYLTFVRRLPVMEREKNRGLLLIHIPKSSLRAYMETLSDKGQTVFVLDADHRILTGSTTELKPYEVQTLLPMIETGDKSGHVFARDPEGERHLYTYLHQGNGRTYVAKIAEDVIRENLRWIQWFILWTVFVFVLVAVMGTVIVSKIVYSPIEKLVDAGKKIRGDTRGWENKDEIVYLRECLNHLSRETETLNEYVEKMRPTYRERFFRHLLEEGMYHNHLAQHMSGMDIPVQEPYIVLAVHVEKLYREKRFLSTDGPVIAFAVKNIIDELLLKEPDLTGDLIEDSEGHIVAVLRCTGSEQEDTIVDVARKFADRICSSVDTYLKLTVAVGIGNVYYHLEDAAISYEEALNALRCRIFKNNENILFIGHHSGAHKEDMFFYPTEAEEGILDALSAGNVQEATAHLQAYSDSIEASESYNLIGQCYFLLLSRLVRMLGDSGNGIQMIFEHDLYSQLKERRSSEEIFDWFTEVFFPLHLKIMDKSKAEQLKVAVMKVCKYIKENATSDLSLVQCSEQVNLSPSYLSRIFKKEMGVTFHEYVLESKIEEAKRMLLETDWNIQKIAQAIGYSERSISRIFKKVTNMTPGQYKAAHR